MNTVVSMAGIVSILRPRQGLDDLSGAGFTSLMPDLGMFASVAKMTEADYRPDTIRRCYENFKKELGKRALTFPVARAPLLSPATKRPDLNARILRLNRDCIRACEEMGCGHIIVQPLFAGIARERIWEENRAYYLTLAQACEKAETKILLLNQCREQSGHLIRGICSDGASAAGWVDSLNEDAGAERFGFCMDSGYCNVCGQDMQAFAAALGGRLRAVILTDNDGRQDMRRLPFAGGCGLYSGTDWLALIRGLRGSGFDGDLILDLQDTVQAFSPLLRPQVLALGRATADYFAMQVGIENALKKYSSVVLFGAGNMCRNYIKCYGAKYPPLFTCDNNEKLWGTEFCGLEVRSPEAMKNLPAGCGVFICNTYYREIEAQLRAMGVEGIEYFNDEYLPSYYFDRIRREE